MRTCLTLIALSVCAAAQAAEPAGEQLKVFIDPETGERRAPTAQELEDGAASSQSSAKAGAQPVAERTADGLKIYRLGPAQRSALKANRGRAGEPLRTGHGLPDGTDQ